MSKPYTDKVKGRFKTRTFESNTDSHELVWHRDKADRVITVLEGNGWFFQMDNNIPFELEEGDVLTIPKMEYHRLYKAGSNNLVIEIEEPKFKSFKTFLESQKIDKSSPIYKEYLQLKKLSIKSLRNQLSRNYKVADLKGYDKEGAISQILRDKYGNKKVDKVFNL